MSDKTKLAAMVAEYPSSIENLGKSIDSIDALITDLTEQKQAIQNVVMSELTSASNVFLAEKTATYTGTYDYCTSGGYGTTNLTDWAIVSGSCLGIYNVVFKSANLSATPSGGSEALQIERQEQFAEAYDHITATIGLGGTYGINDTISNLQTSRGIVVINKAKIETVLEIYSEHLD
jgi:hypothetical protein